MFRGAYTSEFYRALHDALHAEVESWSSPPAWTFSAHDASKAGIPLTPMELEELWARVEQLEQTCRNSDATLLPVLACSPIECS
jgi:hypothetical protein